MPKQRNITLDIAKGLCIILVVIGHYAPASAVEWWKMLHDVIYTFHMPVFLFVSGYLYMLTRRDEKYTTFVKRKMKRLMMPYIVVSYLIITIKILSPGEVALESPVTAYDYLTCLWSPSAGYFLWFIWTLFTMFLIVPLMSSKKQRLIWTVVLGALHFVPVTLPQLFALNETKRMGIYFLLGVVAFDYNQYIRLCSNSISKAIVIMIMIVGEVIYIKSLNCHPAVSYALNNTLSIIGIGAVLAFSDLIKRIVVEKGGWLLVVSAASYTIYLLHTTFMGPFKAILPKLGLEPSDPSQIVLCALVVVVPGILIPTILHRLLLRKWI